ncbi:cytochrome C [Umezakia ovalisporum]|uniref:Cytochrome C n=1 Tax=Umezakia ovalisporum FSS-43 TaxID=2740520 RepID=A0ABT6JZY7_9CYAN|nr:cytochrome C [Umezakia ovalisporum]MDH6055653.1 cytochrome C [Umezakia ovalisporum FSS-43]MDH6066727.1 cytochrome C [Umezakia ovalisporum APH033B]MDH6070861.1 cytochrome C [Umezakia ovalisporum CobakiLakeA]MDH6075180.1 cytochrome C [Umezakia ovalisporum CS-1034]MDH6076606.1 cytochrome C [Umezakia ovalisporum FSS-45]
MSNFVKHQFGKRQLKGHPLGLMVVILAWSLAMGWLLSLATSAHSTTPTSEIGTVDVVPVQYQLGKQLYLENCSSCHIALPPQVLPSQTWRNLLEDSQHYGVQIKPLIDPPRTLVWRYLSNFSRTQLKDEATPYRVNSSRYFQALHPQVDLPRPVKVSSCVSCHPSGKNGNFRRLSGEWDVR